MNQLDIKGIPSYLEMYLDTHDIYFTSDLHMGHKNVIKFDNRPFDSVEEMNESIIENWNKTVSKNSIVFFLGDFSFRSLKQTQEFLDQLNGKIHWINGNHDSWKIIKKLKGFESIQNMLHLKILDTDVKNPRFNGKQWITLCHYPVLVWDKHHHGSWHLHGHCHQNLVGTEMGDALYKRKVIDVGVNGHNYEPLSYQEIKNIMNSKDIDLIDQL